MASDSRSAQSLSRLKQKLARMPAEAKAEIRKAMAKGAEDVVGSAKAFAPVDSGDLRDSIGYTFGEYRAANANVRGVAAGGRDHELSLTVHAGDEKAWYAALVEFGTAPHTIKAQRPGGLLSVNGRAIREVSHPGAAAHPFFFPAWRSNQKKIRARINRAIRSAAKKAVQAK